MTGGVVWVEPSGLTRSLPQGWEPLTGHRTDEAWTWRTVERTSSLVTGTLDGVEGGRLLFNLDADTRGTGSLTWSGPLEDMPSWGEVHVQPVHEVTLGDGSVISWPMGVYLATSPATEVHDGWASCEVQLFDRTLMIRRAKLLKASGVNAGTAVVAHVRSILDAQAPNAPHALEDSAATTRVPLSWDAGTSWAVICNELLSSIGYESLWADEHGVLRSGPYVEPSARPFVHDFADGSLAVHSAEATRTLDNFDAPNRVRVIGPATDTVTALSVTDTLDAFAPEHPLSFDSRGFWVDEVEEGVDGDEAALAARARRVLREAASSRSTIDVVHAPLPLGLGERVSVDVGGLVVPSATVRVIDIDCALGADWRTQLKEAL